MINKFYISDAKVLDDRAGIVEAYVNTMGVRDADGDIIDPAAFNASIKSNLPIPVLAGHDQSKLVGKVLFAQSEPTGSADEHRLYTRMQLNMETQAGQEAYSNIAGEYIREWSVGFNLPAGDAVVYDRAGKETTRRILDLDWVEVSAVIRGASPSTSTIAAKSATVKAPDTYSTMEEAESRADELGCSGAHRMEVDGESVWMPCSTHSAYETAGRGAVTRPRTRRSNLIPTSTLAASWSRTHSTGSGHPLRPSRTGTLTASRWRYFSDATPNPERGH